MTPPAEPRHVVVEEWILTLHGSPDLTDEEIATHRARVLTALAGMIRRLAQAGLHLELE